MEVEGFIRRLSHPFRAYFNGNKTESGQHYILACLDFDPEIGKKANIKKMLTALGQDEDLGKELEEISDKNFISEISEPIVGTYGIKCINNPFPATLDIACKINTFLSYSVVHKCKAEYMCAKDIHNTKRDPLSASRVFIIIDYSCNIVIGFYCYCFRFYG